MHRARDAILVLPLLPNERVRVLELVERKLLRSKGELAPDERGLRSRDLQLNVLWYVVEVAPDEPPPVLVLLVQPTTGGTGSGFVRA